VSTLPQTADVVIVGAGLAGLSAARRLTLAGRDVVVLEASDDFGGRVSTDHVDGLTVDRGFQLYNPSYDEGARILDLESLDLKSFAAGVIVSIDGRHYQLSDPRRDPAKAIDTLLAPVGPFSKKLKFASYAARNALGDIKLDKIDQSTEAFVRREFGDEFTDKMLRPFLAGVFLEDNLSTSKRFFDLVLRSFVRGVPGVPARGMQEIPRQLVAQLNPGSVHLNVRVSAVTPTRVDTSQGPITARAVIVATNSYHASQLIPGLAATPGHAVTTWYHVADCLPDDITNGHGILLVDGKRFTHGHADPTRPVVNTVALTNAAPSYSTDGRVLISSSALGTHPSPQAEAQVRGHLASLYSMPTSGWTHAATYVIPDALPTMTPPHVIAQDPRVDSGLYVAGDYRDVSSINGAFHSGRRAAQALLADGR